MPQEARRSAKAHVGGAGSKTTLVGSKVGNGIIFSLFG